MSILVLAEHDNQELNQATYHAVTAALKIDEKTDILVAGMDCAKVAENAAQCQKVRHVLLADAPCYEHYLPENVAALLAQIAKEYSHIVAAATTTGKNIMPRLAGLLNQEPIADVIGIKDAQTFLRPIYAGNAIATVKSKATIKILTVRTTAFVAAESTEQQAPIKEITSQIQPTELVRFVKETRPESERPELTAAEVVISGGRGMGNSENFSLLYQIADKLGAAVGASRAAVDAGFVPNDMQVGQTGKVVAPKLYIAVGISGAIQHLAGMKDAKVIVAINKDEDAPIFQVADYGLVADLFEVLPILNQLL